MRDAGRVMLIPKGDWDENTTYEILDFVYESGASYVARKASTNKIPKENPEYWQLMAKGIDGFSGWRGTMAEYRQALIEGDIEEGMIIYITDDTFDVTELSERLDNVEKEVDTKLETALEEVDRKIDNAHLIYENTPLPTSLFVEDGIEDYPFTATLSLLGMTQNHIPNVIFNIKDATSGIFAPSVESGAGSIKLYASEIPEEDIIIPSIFAVYGGES